MHRHWIVAPLLFQAFLSPSSARASYDPTNDFLAAFAGRCPLSYGTYNQQPIADIEALKAIVQQLRDDDDCSAVWGTLDALALELDTASKLAPSVAQEQKTRREEYCTSIEDEVTGLSTSTVAVDASLLTYLQSDLASCRYDTLKGTLDEDLTAIEDKYATLANLQKFTTELFAQLSTSDKCLAKNANLPAAVFGQVLAVSSTLVGGVYGAMVYVGGVLLDQTMKYVNDHKFNTSLRRMMSSSMNTAFSCAVEAIAGAYCDARETEKAILAYDEINSTLPQSKPWMGVDLVQKDITNYMSWVSTLSAASDSGSQEQAEYLVKVIQFRAALQELKIQMDSAEISEKKAKTEADKRSVRMNVILTAAMNRAISYFNAEKSTDKEGYCGLALWIYSNGKETGRPDNSTAQCFEYLVAKYPIPPSLEEVKTRVKTLSDNAEKKVNELAEQLNTDSAKIIRDAFTGEPISATEFLEKGNDYLTWIIADYEKRLAKPGLPAKEKLALKPQQEKARELLKKIESSISILYNETIPSAVKVTKLNAELAPMGEYTRLPTDLQKLVQDDIRKRIADGEITAGIMEIMKYSTTKTLGELLSAFAPGENGTASALAQLNDAKRISIDNLRELGRMYDHSLQKSLKDLERKSRGKDDPATYRAALARTCIIATLLPDSVSDGGDLNLDGKKTPCQGVVWKDEVADLELDFNKLVAAKFEDRVCEVYEFNRRSNFLSEIRRAMGYSGR